MRATVACSDLREALTFAVRSVSKDRTGMTGVLFSVSGGKLTIVSTDGSRMTVAPMLASECAEGVAIMGASDAAKLAKSLKKTIYPNATIRIVGGELAIGVDRNEIGFVQPYPAEEFPKWETGNPTTIGKGVQRIGVDAHFLEDIAAAAKTLKWSGRVGLEFTGDNERPIVVTPFGPSHKFSSIRIVVCPVIIGSERTLGETPVKKAS